MIEINLVPDVKLEYIRTRIMRNFVVSMSIMAAIAFVAVASLLAVVYGGQLVLGATKDETIKKESANLLSITDIDKTVTVQRQLSKIEQQHDEKLITSRLFDSIMAINPPAPNQIAVSTLKLNPSEKMVTIEGSATSGFLALEIFKKTLINTYVQVGSNESDRQPLATDFVSRDTRFGENSEGQRVLAFSFTFSYPETLFAVSNDEPVLIVTPVGRMDVTDSRLGVPESLFAPKPIITDGED